MSELALPPLNQQTLLIFSAGAVSSFLLFQLPSLLSPPLPLFRSFLFLSYVLSTHALAFSLWWHRKSLPSPSSFTSIAPDSPLRYSYFFLLGCLLLCQLLFSEEICERVWAPILLFIGHVLAHLPFILYAHTWVVREVGRRMGKRGREWEVGGWVWLGALFLTTLVLVGCGALFTVSEVALSRRDASLAWYVLREMLELLYLMVQVMPLMEVQGGQGERWMAAYVGRMVLWAVLAYVSRLVAQSAPR